MQRNDTKKKKWILALCTALCLVVVLGSQAPAGTLPGEDSENGLNRIEVNLHGVNRLGGVQLFDYLLGKTTGVITIKQVGIRLDDDNPDNCRAGWSLRTAGRTVSDVQQDMMAFLKELDPEKQNEALYEAPFVVMREDLELVKALVPFESAPGYLSFGVEYRVSGDDFREPSPYGRGEPGGTGLPWYMQNDKGFE